MTKPFDPVPFILNKGLAPMEIILPHNQKLAIHEEYALQFDITYGRTYNKTIVRRIEAGIRGALGQVYIFGIGDAQIVWAHISAKKSGNGSLKHYLMIYLTNEENNND